VWVTAGSVADLAEREAIIPLDDAVSAMPWLVMDLSDEVLENLSVEGSLYAIPLGSEPDLMGFGYAITRAAAESGLRERVPRRGRPDLVVSDLDLAAEGGELQLIAELRNVGQQAAENVMAHILMDRELVIGEFVIDRLEAGASHSIEVFAGAPVDDLHGYAVMIDPEGLIEENNESNNLTDYGNWKAVAGSGPPSPPAAIGQPFVLDSNAFRIRSQEWGNSRPNVRVAFGATNYLVVWTQQIKPYKAEYKHRLVGARVSANGVVLDTTPFVITPSVGRYDTFHVSFGSGTFLAGKSTNPASLCPTPTRSSRPPGFRRPEWCSTPRRS